MNRMGDRGFKAVARYSMRDQERSGDGLRFKRRIYEPGLLRRMIWPVARLAMLRRGASSDGRRHLRMPFRKALKRDVWEPSKEAFRVSEQWKETQRKGAKTSFSNSDQ